MKIYISGPISGIKNGNREAFFDAKKLLEGRGFDAVNPHENGLPENASWDERMAVNLMLLKGCDGVAVLPGCANSRGCKWELSKARLWGIEIRPVERWSAA